jgi:hypothetical protein
MPVILANRVAARHHGQATSIEGLKDGYQAKRHTAVRKGAGGMVHWHRPHRPTVQGARSGARQRRQRYIRARRAHGLAHASAGTDWHGASPTTAMTHIAIAEALDGKVVDWMEHVSDAQYPA